MRRAKLPLNPAAVRIANARAGRKLSPTDPADAHRRRQWMDDYLAAGGQVEGSDSLSSSPPLVTPIVPCQQQFDLQYLYSDFKPVPGAGFHAYSVDRLGKKDGIFEKKGVLNDSGTFRVENVPDIQGMVYYFEADPRPLEIKPGRKTAAQPDKNAATSALDEVGNWIWGTVQGDFNKDQSISQIAVNALLGLIPVVDQALDVRDIIAGLKHLLEFYALSDQEQEDKGKYPDSLELSYETWLWLNLFLIAIGSIPILGSAVKGVLKAIIRYLQDAGKVTGKLSTTQIQRLWELAVSTLNHFSVGNAAKWLDELPSKLSGHMNDAARSIKAGLDAIQKMVTEASAAAKAHAGKWYSNWLLTNDDAAKVIARCEQMQKALSRAYKRLDDMKTKINSWLNEQVSGMLPGKHKSVSPGAVNTEIPNRRIQQETPPPDILPPLGTGNWRSTSRTGQLKTVLGKTADGYAEQADKIGANKFQIPDAQWQKMSNEQRWQANREFLDDCIANKSEFALVTHFDEQSGYFFQKEKEYLLQKGYKPSSDGFTLLPPQ
jgi:hypothetical protein